MSHPTITSIPVQMGQGEIVGAVAVKNEKGWNSSLECSLVVELSLFWLQQVFGILANLSQRLHSVSK